MATHHLQTRCQDESNFIVPRGLSRFSIVAILKIRHHLTNPMLEIPHEQLCKCTNGPRTHRHGTGVMCNMRRMHTQVQSFAGYPGSGYSASTRQVHETVVNRLHVGLKVKVIRRFFPSSEDVGWRSLTSSSVSQ